MTAIEYEIFDDILIGNFAKTILHGNWQRLKPCTSPLYPNFTPYVAKYGDNGRARSEEELALYFDAYHRRIGLRGVVDLLIEQIDNRSKTIFRSLVCENSFMYRKVKGVYHSARKYF